MARPHLWSAKMETAHQPPREDSSSSVENSLPIPVNKSVSSVGAAAQKNIKQHLPKLAKAWEFPLNRLQAFYDELQESQAFLADLNRAIQDIPEFAGVQFRHVSELRLYRCLLYLLTRALRPKVFVETGVLNGFSSAFILLAMEHNAAGTLSPRSIYRRRTNASVPKARGRCLRAKDQAGLSLTAYAPAIVSLGDAPPDCRRYCTVWAQLMCSDTDSDHSYEHMILEYRHGMAVFASWGLAAVRQCGAE